MSDRPHTEQDDAVQRRIWEQRCPDLLAECERLRAALEPFTHYDFHATQHIDGLTHEGHALRALWVEDIDDLIRHVATARAALKETNGE